MSAEKTIKTTMFIDSENVGNAWCPLLKDTQRGDQILVFYTSNSPSMSLTEMQQVVQAKARIECISCTCGTKNALDFQLVSELGNRIRGSRRNTRKFTIVSKDKGFDAVVQYWKGKAYDVVRLEPAGATSTIEPVTPTAKALLAPTVKTVSPPSPTIQEIYASSLKKAGLSNAQVLKISPLMVESMKKGQKRRMQTFYQGLCQMYGAAPGLELYHRIRDAIKLIAVNGPFPT